MQNKPLKDQGRFPTTTVLQARVGIFTPTSKRTATNKEISVEFSNEYGSCKVTGPQTNQRHKDVIEAIITNYTSKHIHQDGDWSFCINLREVLKILGGMKHEDFKSHLEDLRKTSIEIRRSGFGYSVAGVITRFEYAEAIEAEGGKFAPWKYNKVDFVVKFSREYIAFFGKDLQVFYPSLVPKITLIKNGVVKAAVRLILSLPRLNAIPLDDLLSEIVPNWSTIDKKRRSQHRKAWREASEQLRSIGITTENDEVKYQRDEKTVTFYNPAKEQKGQTVKDQLKPKEAA